ncbi:MAG: right-handed parallel beta-helix repeat-containing protein, partial [Chloroflexota bacterium]
PASPTPPPPPPPCSIPNTGNINGFRIANCTITGATKKETGIHVIQGFLGLIENCYIKGFDKGIHFVGTGDCATGGCVIRACRIEANNTGLEYDELISGTLVGNTIQDNSRPSPDYGIGLLVTNGANLTSVGNHYENKVLPEDIDVKIVAGNAMNFVGDKFNSSNPGKNLVYSGGNFVYIRGGKLIGGVTATGNNAAGDNANIVQELVERVTSASDLGPGHHVRLKMEWPELIGLRAKEWRMWKPMPVPPDPPGAVYTEYGYLRWSGNVFALGTETNAGGSGRELRLQAGNKEVVVWDSRLSIVQNEGAPALSVNGSGGQKWNVSQKSELTTIGTGSVTETWTDTGIKIPANAVVFGVSVRVVEAIPNPVPPIPGLDPSFMVTGAADTSPVFSTVDDVPTAAGSTDVGTKNCPYKNGAAELAIRIKPNYNPPTAAGKVRVTIHYYEITP